MTRLTCDQYISNRSSPDSVLNGIYHSLIRGPDPEIFHYLAFTSVETLVSAKESRSQRSLPASTSTSKSPDTLKHLIPFSDIPLFDVLYTNRDVIRCQLVSGIGSPDVLDLPSLFPRLACLDSDPSISLHSAYITTLPLELCYNVTPDIISAYPELASNTTIWLTNLLVMDFDEQAFGDLVLDIASKWFSRLRLHDEEISLTEATKTVSMTKIPDRPSRPEVVEGAAHTHLKSTSTWDRPSKIQKTGRGKSPTQSILNKRRATEEPLVDPAASYIRSFGHIEQDVLKVSPTKFLMKGLDDSENAFIQAFQSWPPQPFKIKGGSMQELGAVLTDETHNKLTQFEWLEGEIGVVNCNSLVLQSMTPEEVKDHFNSSFKQSTVSDPLNMTNNDLTQYPIARHIIPPKFLTYYDWSTRFLPERRRAGLKYFSLSDGGSVSLFHPDFAGSTTFLWALHGHKDILILDSSEDNLRETVFRFNSAIPTNVELEPTNRIRLIGGEGLLLPGGLIHAVHTKIPTSMIMTNILHDYNIVTQIKVWELERDLRSPKSYLMPGFVWLNWLAAVDLLGRLEQALKPDVALSNDILAPSRGNRPLPKMDSLIFLSDFLLREMESITSYSKMRLWNRKGSVSEEQVREVCSKLERGARRMMDEMRARESKDDRRAG